MSWKDDFREGSFRGVQFFTEQHTLTGGRRKQDREFAKRDTGNSEDLGKKLRVYQLEIYVLGDDYFDQRDDMIEALETEGPGELIHPYLGTIQVQAGTFVLTEIRTEGRIARFNVEFSEKGEVKFPAQAEDNLLNSITNAKGLIENSLSFFEQAINTVNQVAFVIQAAADDVENLVDSIEDAITAVTEPITNLTFAISDLKANINDLIRLPGELGARISGVFDDLLAEFEDDPRTAERVLSVFVGNLDTAFDPVIGSTNSRNTQRNNQEAIKNFGKEIGLANQTIAAVQVDFASTEEALESRNSIVDALEIQLEVVTPDGDPIDDDLFQSIKDVQTSLTEAVPEIGTSELINYTPPITLPALVIAYDLFEDVEKENEIIQENAVEHPAFVPGGKTIQVSAG